MHELSLVTGVISICTDTISRHPGKRISKVVLEIGSLSGVDMPSFEFAWKRAVPGTVLEGATAEINEVTARAKCTDCGMDFEISNLYDPCPGCGGYFRRIYQGDKMNVKYIEVEDAGMREDLLTGQKN